MRTHRLVFLVLIFLVQPVFGAKRRPANSGEGPLLSKILQLEEQRMVDQVLLNALNHPSSRVRKAAILALGRISDPSTLAELATLMNKRRYGEKKEVAFALGLFDDETATTVVVQHLAMQKDPAVLRELFLSLGRQGTEKHLQAVTRPILEGGPVSLLEPACLALGMLWSKGSEEWVVPENILPQLAKSLSSRQSYGPACAFAASRFKGNDAMIPTKEYFRSAQVSGSNEVKSFVARALGRSKDPESMDDLVSWASAPNDVGLRIEAVKAMGQHVYSEKMKDVFSKNLADKNSSLVVQTLMAIAAHGSKLGELAPKVDAIFAKSTSTWQRSQALRALAELDIAKAKARMEEVFKSGPPALLPAAVYVLAVAPRPEDIQRIPVYLQHDSPRIVVEMLDALSVRHDGEWPPEWRAALQKSLERADPAICAAASQMVTRLQWKDFAPVLTSALGKLTQSDQIEPKVAILSALGAVGGSSQVAALQAALNDTQRAVVEAAAGALKALTGQDFSQRVPPNSRFPASNFDMGDIDKAIRSEVVLKTTRGDIVLAMTSDAPITALNFTRLAQKKFYDGLAFHRVVPHFVSQGGDPRGDGYGGSGYLVRDEFASVPQLRSSVGVATSGRDTGGSQFYINLGPNRHLDGRYTVFAKVIQGMDVADRLEEGDRILSARVR